MNEQLSRRRSSRSVLANSSQQNNAPAPKPEKPKTHDYISISRFLPRILVLENTNSVARDHMANERTFLAWIRTAFVLLSMGIVFIQMYSIQLRAEAILAHGERHLMLPDKFRSFHALGKPIAVLSGVFSVILIIFGYVRYVAVQSGLQKSVFPATRVIASLVLVATLVLVILALVADVDAVV
ncbi:hypothetical protein EJF18_50669 [Clavispora lusitaniae]|uniref:Uncharacterized protein n=1 Tax=Clavispora lusitaniae TaxID=36911 RepID=A0ACD0WPG5_CLALS|nr:hypothetical protein EJF14_50669 [Clavispora lusitaniae]QFZ35092.1 hypothetical protein EJF16_50669 [Clavispora lusitaniae]QFZ46457.1 hypothetical protein EJF18_50669 [Clavispora lusitaniae]QFZ52119.1 hypothetical protein EJF17_50669 [Clavispora lusitaniae]